MAWCKNSIDSRNTTVSAKATTPQQRIFLEQLTASQVVKKFPAFVDYVI
jgi:hypothetical protein